jgi:hypothetical protein
MSTVSKVTAFLERRRCVLKHMPPEKKFSDLTVTEIAFRKIYWRKIPIPGYIACVSKVEMCSSFRNTHRDYFISR